MGNLVIVAIPREDDYVWKISSEKKPHLTLLFLGESDSNPKVPDIMQFVQHAVQTSEHGEFYLDVDRRGELGDDKADVLFFRKDWSSKWIRDFRAQLLQEPNIKSAYDSTEQFPEWLPHLTLGYPETPAKTDESEFHRLYSVSFDRIGVWTGDFEGPEFRLQWPEREFEDYGGAVPAAGWSATASKGASAVAELLHISEKPWSEYSKADYSVEQWHRACLIHQHEGDPTSKSKCKLPVKTPDGAVNRNGVHAAAAALAGARGGVQASQDEKEKAMSALRGLYKKLDEEPPESLKQTADLGVDFLSHYGVKGMRWGVRKENETKGEGARRYFDPEGHSKGTDIFKAVVWPAVPPLGIFAIPAQTRLVVGGIRGTHAKVQDVQDKRFAKKAQSAKNFVEIHNRSGERFNREIEGINSKYPDDLTKNPRKQKQYDAEVLDLMQRSYREAANSIGSRSGNLHLDLEFKNDGMDFAIKAREGAATPLPQRVKHAEGDDEVVEFTLTGKIKRDATGHIVGFEFDDQQSMAQTVDLGVEFLAHYGVKGMRWGVRKSEPETKRSGLAGRFDPEGHSLKGDIVKGWLVGSIPVVQVLAIPAQVRLARGGFRAGKAKGIDIDEKRFAKKAQSQKNFVKIHNKASPKINEEIPKLNARHPGDITKDPKKQKAYNEDAVKVMQDAYREAANSIGNRSRTMHLDLEFRNDGMDFAIKAKPGQATPLPKRMKHADEDDELVEFTGKIQRDDTGHIVKLVFDDFEEKTAQHTVDLGAEFLEHYGVKGMRWGVRRDPQERLRTPVNAKAVSIVPAGRLRKTQVRVAGGENHSASDDAIKVAQARVKLARSGPHALSNNELREVANRLELEERVTRATRSKGRKFISDVVIGEGKQAGGRYVRKQLPI